MYLVFDIGGTNMRIGVSDDGSTILKSKSAPTPKDFEEGIKTLKQISDELSQGEKIEAVAGGAAVVFDKLRQTIIKSAHLLDWINKPIMDELKRMFNCPVFLENETALEGLGEAVLGAGKDENIVVFITVGTGVGGVKIVNSRLDDNLLGFEPGHQIIVPDGVECTCGGKGHLEVYVGGWYLEKKYHQQAKEISDPKIWDEVSRYLAIGLNNTIVHWSPDIVVLGGSVAKSIPLDTVRSYLNKFLTIFPTKPPIVRAQLDYPGLYGALQLIKSQLR